MRNTKSKMVVFTARTPRNARRAQRISLGMFTRLSSAAAWEPMRGFRYSRRPGSKRLKKNSASATTAVASTKITNLFRLLGLLTTMQSSPRENANKRSNVLLPPNVRLGEIETCAALLCEKVREESCGDQQD